MILNAAQIVETQNKLSKVLEEQKSILQQADTIINVRLSGAWECKAQKAYQDAYLNIKNNMLTQINNLIELFGRAFEISQTNLCDVDIDISTMNAKAVS